MTEEFVWPGGFGGWYRDYRPEIAKSLTNRYLVLINAFLLAMCGLCAFLGFTPRGAALFLTITAILGANGLFHLWATIRGKRYSPGVITGIALYAPLAIYSYIAVLNAELATVETAIVSAVMGSSYHWISVANHRRRSAASVALD